MIICFHRTGYAAKKWFFIVVEYPVDIQCLFLSNGVILKSKELHLYTLSFCRFFEFVIGHIVRLCSLFQIPKPTKIQVKIAQLILSPLLNGLQNYKIHVVFLRFFHITLLEIAQIHSLCFILANKDGRTLCPCCPFPFRFPPLATAFSHLHSGPVRFSLSLRRLPLPPPCSVFPGVRYFYPASCVIPFSRHSVFPFQSPDSLFAHREKAPRRFFPKQGRRITFLFHNQ